MNNTARYLLAGILIFLIIILQPTYLEWLGYDSGDGDTYNEAIKPAPEKPFPAKTPLKKAEATTDGIKKPLNNLPEESFITVSTPLYTATLTNRSGGSFVDYIINEDNSDKR